MERIAAISFQARGQKAAGDDQEGSKFREAALSICHQALEHSLKLRLQSVESYSLPAIPTDELEQLALLLRELINLSFALRPEGAFDYLQKISTLIYSGINYPPQEAQWAAAHAWDTAQLFLKTGKLSEFESFGDIAAKLCENPSPSNQLQHYAKSIRDYIHTHVTASQDDPIEE